MESIVVCKSGWSETAASANSDSLAPGIIPDHLYGLLLTFGLALIIEGLFRQQFGASGLPYINPIPGGQNLGFMFLPWYRGGWSRSRW